MQIDWQNVQVRLRSAGKFLSVKGVPVDPTWKFWMYDQMFWYVWSGCGDMMLPEGKIRLKPGVCLWLRPGFEYRHRQQPLHPLGVYSVHFDLLTADGQSRPSDAPLPPELLSPPDEKYVERVVDRLARMNPETNVWGTAMTPLARKQATCLLTALLMELDRAAVVMPGTPRHELPHIAHINDIARRIDADPTQFNSIADMARELRYSRSYFTRLFHKVRSNSPRYALRMSRLRYAAHLLLETDLPIKAIAERMGYCDVPLFTNQFRCDMGVSPSRYRKRNAARRSLATRLEPSKS